MNQSTFPRPEIVAAVASEWAALDRDAHRLAPTLAAMLAMWVRTVFGDHPENAFTALESHPLVHLPLWAMPTITPPALAAITRSTISGYLYVRLIDNAFDADTDGPEVTLLPVAAYLHTEFQLAYQRLFPFDHSFWETFRIAWTGAAEAALADRAMGNPDIERFEQAAARKTMSAVIPVAAALYVGDEPDRLPAWSRFVESFGRWHQLENDFFGWRKDHQHGNPNLIVGEAMRQASDPLSWFAKEGYEWGAGLLARYGAEAEVDASGLDSPDLLAYLRARFSGLQERIETLRLGMSETARLARLLGPAP